MDGKEAGDKLGGLAPARVLWAYCGLEQFGGNRYKCFGMMVARDGIEPPTPAFSGLRSTI